MNSNKLSPLYEAFIERPFKEVIENILEGIDIAKNIIKFNEQQNRKYRPVKKTEDENIYYNSA